jgi:hypothetical protein
MLIAFRQLTLRTNAGTLHIPIRIFAPEQEEPGVCGCVYEVGWPEGDRKVTAYGFDSTQAILIAMQMVGSEIYTSDYHKSGRLFWRKPGNGYGFPVAPTLRDLLEGDDTKYL